MNIGTELGMFYEKELQKANQAEFRIEKNNEMITYILHGNLMIIRF